MRERFDNKLNDVEESFVSLADLYLLNFEKFILYKDSPEVLDEVIQNEAKINSRIDIVKDMCYTMMLREAPVASDLRFIQTSMSLTSSFRRIYSHLVEAAIILKEIESNESLLAITEEMLKILNEMLTNFRNALVERNEELAYNTIKMDDQVDELFEKSIDFAIGKEREKVISTNELANLILYFKYFERIGDRLAKINSLITNL
ncbi:PhoU domain-containing protein [Anaerococcus sp. AGMB09787]|uniref:phosphate signaling complex PhoU family protein n=1 Tax=Anaerococcus sp. AGMB09787 TaxID=2922869 RepID=UPI001FAEB75B|nr:PhoU domain-containing protein [Anaerococcus sp. AGMB09787]